jgi:hypothetical protein
MTIPRIMFALVVLALLAAACDRDDDDDDSTPTSEPSATAPAATAEPTVSSEIRTMDLGVSEPVQALITDTGGAFAAADVLYADLTEDGVEEAVAPISSGGSAGNVAVSVLTPAGEDEVEELLQRTASAGGGLVANVVDDQLVLTEPAPGPDDPECCPTQLQTTIYQWDGDSLEVESETLSPNPEAGDKTPTSP